MNKIIAINAGSSSLKFTLYQMPAEEDVALGLIERIGLGNSVVSIKYGNGEKYEEVLDLEDHSVAIKLLLEKLIDLKIIEDYNEIVGVGHRVVAGGEYFKDSALIDEDVIAKIDELAEYAPLHNPANLLGIRAFKEVLPNIPSVAVFDTSFHATMPPKAYLYSLPMEYYKDFGARRYGFHGTSHNYVSQRVAELEGKNIEDLKIITCHLGNGGSITAVDGGKSVDTSMGFTPLAGITMGTRTGDIDASLIPFLMSKTGITDVQDMIDIFNKESGLKGLSGVSSDMRDVEEAANAGNEDAQVAIEIFYDRVVKYIGSYAAVMKGVDAIVFTAGIGENSITTRQGIMDSFEFAGIKLDAERNNTRSEALISTDDSKVKVYTIPTDEELMIVRDVVRLGNI